MLCSLLVFLCAAGFSESDANADAGERPLPEEPVLALSFLVHEPGVFNFTKYQTLDGTPLSYKETNALLDSVPENKKPMKRHRLLRGSSFVFAGMLAACIATDAVYVGVDDLPHKDAVVTLASSLGLCSAFASILTGDASTAQYLLAVDNYNTSLLPSSR